MSEAQAQMFSTHSSNTVSVIMPAYNCAEYIEMAITSVLSQTYPDWELLITDDASKDSTAQIAAHYASLDSRIRLVCNKENKGIVESRNQMLDAAKGSFVTFLDSDDWLDQRKIELQVAFIREYKCAAVGTNYYRVGLDGKTVSNTSGSFSCFLDKNDINQLPLWPPSVMVTRKLLEQVGMFHWYFRDMACYEDKYWLYNILEISKIGFLDEPLYFYRHNANSVTKSLNFRRLAGGRLVNELIRQRQDTGTDWLISGDFKSANDYIKGLENDRKWKAEMFRIYAAIKTDERNFTSAMHFLGNAFQSDPLNFTTLRTFLYFIRARFGFAPS